VRVGVEENALLSATTLLRSEVHHATFPLDLPSVDKAHAAQSALIKQLDDYLIPRLTALDAPLLAVVGGSTGAGKSTLVNSLVGSLVSQCGVIRPTTRHPVLVHHPKDEPWFNGRRVLPDLDRITGGFGPVDSPRDDHDAIRLVSSVTLPAGLALLDAPDIDSVVHANRDLAGQLFMAADLWIFVTTASRYADAVPWQFLREAFEHGTAVAIVLDRVPPDAMDEIRSHLASMLREQGLNTAPIFTIPETTVTADGLLSERQIARLRSWLSSLARDAKARSIVIRRTLNGALRSIPDAVITLSGASAEQELAATALHLEVQAAYLHALQAVQGSMTDESLLRGEVLARWQEFVGKGESPTQGDPGVLSWLDRISAAVKDNSPATVELGKALQSGVADLLTAHSRAASTTVRRRWRQLPGGAALVAARPELESPVSGSAAEVGRLVHDWQADVLDLVRAEAYDRRTTARVLSFGVDGVAVILMLLVFSETGGPVEGDIEGSSPYLAQRILEAIFGDQAVRSLVGKGRRSLTTRTQELYFDEQAPLRAAVSTTQVSTGQADRIKDASALIEAAQ
jgi:energy-coupling factor transporter ATP-binding protein EcfA2